MLDGSIQYAEFFLYCCIAMVSYPCYFSPCMGWSHRSLLHEGDKDKILLSPHSGLMIFMWVMGSEFFSIVVLLIGMVEW